MNDQKRVALFVDVDNLQLNAIHIENLLARIETDGDIVYAKFYGAVDRKYKDIAEIAKARGFELSVTMRNKKRGAKAFDTKILVDVTELIYTNNTIDTVAVVSQPADLVHLFSKLKKQNVEILAVDFLDEDCLKFVDQVLYFDYNGPAKPLPKAKSAPRPVVAPKAAKVNDNAPELDILKELNKLKQSAATNKNDNNSGDDRAIVDQITSILEDFKELDI